MDERIPDADAAALERLLAVRPAWTGLPRAVDALDLQGGRGERVLLHAGPPATAAEPLVRPILHSAAVAAVFEGWAATLAEGLELVQSGTVRFEPAQDRGVATPMAAVVSPSMRLIEMTDLVRPEQRAYAPLNGGGTGGGPGARYGRLAEEALARLRFLNGEVAEMLAPACAEPVEWLPVVDHGLVHGDDAHLRHAAANERLRAILAERLGPGFAASPVGAFVAEWPIFHLNFFMAAARLALRGASGVPGSGVITAFGGNGAAFGLQVSGRPGRWLTVPATPPRGKIRPPHRPETTLGAFGDSALAEAFGLGALAHRYCPEMRALHADFYHDDLLELPGRLLLAAHPGLPRSGARAGLSARRIVAAGVTPVVELGIVDAAGIDGGLGAGLYRPPLALFAAAVEALDGAEPG